MVYELERVLRVCNGFLCSMPVTYDEGHMTPMPCTKDYGNDVLCQKPWRSPRL